MEVKDFLCMKDGEGDTNYAHNSYTRRLIAASKPMLEKAIEDLLNEGFHPNVLTIADLGCAIGPNTFSVVTTIKRSAEKKYYALGVKQPELQVFLNDLPGNDFNSIFNFFSANHQQLEGEGKSEGKMCFVTGVPGSFYERLFPIRTLHFVHSSYSVHWLSRVPPGLTSEEGIPLNKGNIYISNDSPPAVKKAYLQQFQEDFTLFLKLRSKELVPNALMMLILHGRRGSGPPATYAFDRLAEVLVAMVSQGLIEEEKLDSFNMPYYTATCEEAREVINDEGSFNIKHLAPFSLDVRENEATDMRAQGERTAKNIRAFTESLISQHFGHEILEPLYERLKHIVIDDMLKNPSPDQSVSIGIILQRKNW